LGNLDDFAVTLKFASSNSLNMPATANSTANLVTSDFDVEGMTCGNCVRHAVEAAQGVPGVRSATASVEKKSVTVKWDGSVAPSLAEVVKALGQAGYRARLRPELTRKEGEPVEASCCEHGPAAAADAWQIRMWLGVVATAAMMIGEWVFQLGENRQFQWASLFLATIVQAVAGWQFYKGAWNQFKHGRSNMDTLVALGSTTAYGYSLWAFLTGYHGHLYFMEAAAIISLVSLGHWIESRVSEKASGALRLLLNLAPATARRLGANQLEEVVNVGNLRPGDVVVLRPGDTIPVDASVREGEGSVDEAMLTGESAPINKKFGSPVYAGTANVNGRLVVRVTETGQHTALARVIEAVERAQNSRTNIQKLGDRVSSIFVPIVVLIALASALWWGLAPAQAHSVHAALAGFLWHSSVPDGRLAAAFIIAAAVLIVACPCAMGLATPAAIMAGANSASRRGILVRDGLAFERAGSITAVVFDKTGTLTTGKPAVAGTWHPALSNADQNSEATLSAAALARGSNHPLSQAISALSHASTTTSSVSFSDWREISGAGVEARAGVGDKENRQALLRLGSLEWLRDAGVGTEEVGAFNLEWSGRGATVLGFARDTQLVAAFALQDTLKPGARQVVADLRAQGLAIFMITGDQAATAMAIAEQCGIAADHVRAQVRPEQKAQWIKGRQAEGHRISFVGDGINDAPALKQANLGIAVSRASDIAREAADIILLKSEIEAVPEALNLARTTLRIIKQNLFWAFFYNALSIPLASLGLMSPILCAAAMGFSDIIVVGNALRLLRWKYRPHKAQC
jgi:Cu+-exporting ATPase